MIMMKFVTLTTKEYSLPTVVSLNTLMVDGTGMCGACRVTVGGKTVFTCVDGPEFDGFQVDFDEAMRRQGMYRTQEERARASSRSARTVTNAVSGSTNNYRSTPQPDVSGRRVWSDALRPNAEGVHRTMKANNYGK